MKKQGPDTEWRIRVERYAAERIKDACRAESVSKRFPDHEKSFHRALLLRRIADEWMVRALELKT